MTFERSRPDEAMVENKQDAIDMQVAEGRYHERPQAPKGEYRLLEDDDSDSTE